MGDYIRGGLAIYNSPLTTSMQYDYYYEYDKEIVIIVTCNHIPRTLLNFPPRDHSNSPPDDLPIRSTVGGRNVGVMRLFSSSPHSTQFHSVFSFSFFFFFSLHPPPFSTLLSSFLPRTRKWPTELSNAIPSPTVSTYLP